MQELRMVPVAKVADGFHARVLVARLGSEGIVTQLRGGVDGPYPMGAVEVLVGAPDIDLARGLLLADEVESAFPEIPDGAGGYEAGDDEAGDDEAGDDGADYEIAGPDRRRAAAPWVTVAVLVALILFAYVNTVGYQTGAPGADSAPLGEEPGEGGLVEPAEGSPGVGSP